VQSARPYFIRATRNRLSTADPYEMKTAELFRNIPANIHELHLAVAGLPKDMKVKAHSATGVSEKTVDELRARTSWTRGLVVTTPRDLHPKSVVKISKT